MSASQITCIVEWENAQALEREAARGFLDGIAKRLTEFGTASNLSTEILLVFDEDVAESDLREDIAACPSITGGNMPVRLLYAPGAKYYEKKGLAAKCVESEILLYGDSDCDFVPGWIEALVGPILRDEADMCRGATLAKMEEGVVPLASALAWFFSTPNARDPIMKTTSNRFFANNFAVRRPVLDTVPLPRLDGSRTTGGPWLKRVRDAKFRDRHVPEAEAHHKQYDTFGDLTKRAWLLGKDRDVSAAIAGRRRSTRVLRAIKTPFALSGTFLHRLIKVGPAYVKLWQVVPVLALGLWFQLVAGAAQIVSAVSRDLRPERTSYDDLVDASTLMS